MLCVTGNQLGWQSLVKYLTHKWKLMISSNMRASLSSRSVLVVFFEEIKKDPALQLAKMMEFLEVSVSPTAINTAIMVCNDIAIYYIIFFLCSVYRMTSLHSIGTTQIVLITILKNKECLLIML